MTDLQIVQMTQAVPEYPKVAMTPIEIFLSMPKPRPVYLEVIERLYEWNQKDPQALVKTFVGNGIRYQFVAGRLAA